MSYFVHRSPPHRSGECARRSGAGRRPAVAAEEAELSSKDSKVFDPHAMGSQDADSRNDGVDAVAAFGRGTGKTKHRLFVGDSVEFSQTKTAPKRMRSETKDAENPAATRARNSSRGNAASSDSIVSRSSSFSSSHSKENQPRLSSSSSSSLATEANDDREPPKKKKPPLLGKNIPMTHADDQGEERREDPESKPGFGANGICRGEENPIDGRERKHDQNQGEETGNKYDVTIQQILSLRDERFLRAQSELTLPQLRRRARQKARAARESREARPKRKRARIGGKRKKRPSAKVIDAEEEPAEKLELNTGVLYLYRGENPRVEFRRRR